MKRRTFVAQTAVVSGAVVFSPALICRAQKTHIGVQLYSVRDDMQRDAVGTLQRIGAMGYQEVEGAGYADGKFYGMTPAEFKNQLESAGLKMPSGHFLVSIDSRDAATGQMSDVFKQAVESAVAVGQKMLVCPSMHQRERNEESLKMLCEVFNHAGQYCRDAGLAFAYHNHAFEFEPAGDKLIQQHLIDLTDSALVEFQLDLYWVRYAHHDPVEWIKKAPGRTTSFHVKDMADTEHRETIEVGEGVIDFGEIFRYSDLAGIRYYIVELEHYRSTPMEGIEISLRNLRRILDA